MNKESISASIRQTAEIAKIVLMPGDPLRAKYIAEHFLEEPVLFNDVRNMLGYTGTYKGKKISVMGSGMGIPSFAIYATELYREFGVEAIIRIGSAGGVSEGVKLGNVVIAEASSTNSAYADYFDFPGKLAPCADYTLLTYAVESAKEIGVPVSVGNVFSSDHFYNPDPECTAKLKKYGILAVEMESAGLYWVSQQHGKKALALFTISDHLVRGEAMTADERQNSFTDMMKVALETAWKAV